MFRRRNFSSLLIAFVALAGLARGGVAQTPPPAAIPPPAAPTQLMPPAAPQAMAPANSSLQIVWEVKNRFRLFREERDFKLHADYLRSRSILESEDALAIDGEGRGWARNMFRRLCIDQTSRQVSKR